MRMNYSDADNVTGAGVDLVNIGEFLRVLNDMDALRNGNMAIDKIGLDRQFRLVCIAHKTHTDRPDRYVLGKDVFPAGTDESDVYWANGSYDYTSEEVEQAYAFEHDPYAEDDAPLIHRVLRTVWYSAEYRESRKLI